MVSLFVFQLLDRKDLVDGLHYIAEDVVLANDVGIGTLTVNDDKLVRTFMIPDYVVNSVSHQFYNVQCFGG